LRAPWAGPPKSSLTRSPKGSLVRGVEWCGCGRSRDGEKGHGHFWAIGQDNRHTVIVVDTRGLQARGDLIGQVSQGNEAKLRAACAVDGTQLTGTIRTA